RVRSRKARLQLGGNVGPAGRRGGRLRGWLRRRQGLGRRRRRRRGLARFLRRDRRGGARPPLLLAGAILRLFLPLLALEGKPVALRRVLVEFGGRLLFFATATPL